MRSTKNVTLHFLAVFHIVTKMPSVKHSGCLKKTGCNGAKLLIIEQIVRSAVMLSLRMTATFMITQSLKLMVMPQLFILISQWEKGEKVCVRCSYQ